MSDNVSDTDWLEAVENDDVSWCEELLEAGADVNIVNAKQRWLTPLQLAASRGSKKCMPVLLKAGAYLDMETGDEYETALHMAAKAGREACVSLLVEAGASVDAVDRQDRTPLHWAAQNGSEACVSLLLKAGAWVNAINKYEETPLLMAAMSTNVACVCLLLKAGANANAAPSVEGEMPLLAAVEGTNKMRTEGSSKLRKACVSLLLDAGADANAANHHGWTPLAYAIETDKGNVALVALLAAAVTHLQVHVWPELFRVSEADQTALADESHWRHAYAVEEETRRIVTIAVLQGESRWRRRRPLALIREQRRAVRDAGLVHKKWEWEKQEASRRSKMKQQKRGSGR